MFLVRQIGMSSGLRFLHARGDVSISKAFEVIAAQFSPRTWRCFQHRRPPCFIVWVFSTHVEMFLHGLIFPPLRIRFLHARGDVSSSAACCAQSARFSPRTWRCFQLFAAFIELTGVFSTHVEMFLPQSPRSPRLRCFLHARGDVSAPIGSKHSLYTFSPRTWRCFCSLTSVNLPG